MVHVYLYCSPSHSQVVLSSGNGLKSIAWDVYLQYRLLLEEQQDLHSPHMLKNPKIGFIF
jgi:hypothetical protein